ncbi:MAG: hypothetical protein NT027_02480 [Proteobacteria bacterium]|nr:hypothetical protein [Pseudomonadota bacterium]
MRRHSPFALKLLVTAGAVCFLCLDAMFGLNLQSGVYFALFLSGSLLVIGVFVILRDRDELSPSENQIIDAFSVISFLSTPLVLTDFREEFDFPVRAGSIAVLMAVYIFLRASKKEPTRKIIFLELSRQLLRGCIIGAGFWALFFHDLPINEIDYLVCCLISYSLLLLFTILDHVSARNHESAASSVTSWIAGGKFDSRFDFKLALAEIGSLSDSISISQNDLEKYNIPELKSFFHANKVTSLSKLRRNASVSEGIESQIFDILTSNGATHLLVLSEDPLEILLCRLPELEIGAIGINELGAIQKVGELTYRSKPNEG